MDAALKQLKNHWHKHSQHINQSFLSQEGSAAHHIQQLATLIDQTIARVYDHVLPTAYQSCCTIVAVGGYGRIEIFPQSDIDIVVLYDPNTHEQGEDIANVISSLLHALWDIGLAISHSSRTLIECLQQARTDITIITNLMEARYISGSIKLFEKLSKAIDSQSMWSSKDFLKARLKEQQIRYQKYGRTAYCIEPDIKYSPGGLRDLQTIFWLAKHHYHIQDLSELVNFGILLPYEYRQLIKCQHYLWKIRFALHVYTRRQENRLLLEHQKQLAVYFGFEDESYNIAVELFMKRYYQTIKTFNEINNILLALIQEDIQSPTTVFPESDHPYFTHDEHRASVKHPKVFLEHPENLLAIFLYISEHEHCRDISAATRRLIYQSRHLINESFRSNAKHRQIFSQILALHQTLAHTLNLMHDVGVLGHYIPAFNKIIGQTQFDLYHLYPVDKHTLILLSQISKFTDNQYRKQFSLASQIMSQVKNPTCLYIAGLFHDIGKGQDEDHSCLGAKLVTNFCHEHHISKEETTLIMWLVENHLLMSTVAQKQDISDPDVLAEFVQALANQDYLNALYVLTIADIVATNTNLWNGWRDSLLKRLYYAATTLLQQNRYVDRATLIHHSKQSALQLLMPNGLSPQNIQALWEPFEKNYFLNHSAETIVWHTTVLLTQRKHFPLIEIQTSAQMGNEIFIYCNHVEHLFATTVTILDRLQLNVINASFSQTSTDHQIASYFIVDHLGQTIKDESKIDFIKNELHLALTTPHYTPKCSRRRITKQLQQFTIPTEVTLTEDKKRQCHILNLIARDRPGLLAKIAMVFMRHNIELKMANILTLGERADDVYYITDHQNKPIHDQTLKQQICDDIKAALL